MLSGSGWTGHCLLTRYTSISQQIIWRIFTRVCHLGPIGRAEDAGEYTCTATSQTDHFSRNIRLLIQSKILKRKRTFFALVFLNELNFQNNFTPKMLQTHNMYKYVCGSQLNLSLPAYSPILLFMLQCLARCYNSSSAPLLSMNIVFELLQR
jgi:hypothetical protein